MWRMYHQIDSASGNDVIVSGESLEVDVEASLDDCATAASRLP